MFNLIFLFSWFFSAWESCERAAKWWTRLPGWNSRNKIKMVEHKLLSFADVVVDSCSFTNSHTPKVEMHTRKNWPLCCESEAILVRPGVHMGKFNLGAFHQKSEIFVCRMNGIFHQAEPISFYSRLSTFATKNYSTKCWKIVMKWLSWVPEAASCGEV